jgi:hypothetical protein
MKRLIWLIFSLIVVVASSAVAAPNLISYQGVLTDSAGAAVTNPSQAMTFRLFDAETAGNLLWEEVRTVGVQNGNYNLLLGSVTALDPALLAGDNVWLEVVVDAEVLGGRQRLASVPYALRSAQAMTADVALSVPDGSITAESLAAGVVPFTDGDLISCYNGPAVTRGVGLCQPGSKTWQGSGFGGCVGEVVPVTEFCNGADDDCNGQIDDGAVDVQTWYPDLDADLYGDPAGAVDGCAPPTPGYYITGPAGDCADGSRHTSPVFGERCDGTDTNCDGNIDENCIAATCATADLDAVLAYGQIQAALGIGHALIPSPFEICGLSWSDPSCLASAAGVSQACAGAVSTYKTCEAAAIPYALSQYGIDCEIDPLTNYHLPYTITPNCVFNFCKTQYEAVFGSLPSECTTGETRPCGIDTGICSAGNESCVSGYWVGICSGEVGPVAEICGDGLDNDCDGEADELDTCADADQDGTPVSLDCDDNDPALNMNDVDQDGWTSCDGDCDDNNNTVYPEQGEVCDGIDNNCNSQIDEGLPANCLTAQATSAEIMAVRDNPSGSTGQTISGALVTYVQPAIGNDPAGFYLQAEQTGPALFVAVDPSLLSPVTAVGDVVSFVVDSAVSTATGVQVDAISNYVSTSRNNSTDPYLQAEVIGEPLSVVWSDYENELILADGTIDSAWQFAGIGFQSSGLYTPAGETVEFRIPDSLHATFNPAQGCPISVSGTPLTSRVGVPQIRAWDISEITTYTSPEICTDGIDSDCDGQIDCSDTDCFSEPPCDTCGNGICGSAESWSNCKLDCPVGLVINEVDYDQTAADTAEFIEIYNASGAAIDLTGYVVELINGADDSVYAAYTLSNATATLAAGEYLVLGSTSLVATLFPGVANIIIPDEIIQNGAPDGIHLSNPANPDAGTDSLVYEGAIFGYGEGTPLSVGDGGLDYDSLARCPNGTDTDDNDADFILVDSNTPGFANLCP